MNHLTMLSGKVTKPKFQLQWLCMLVPHITDNWGIDAQIGMISSNLEGKYYQNLFGIFAVGASYKF